MHILYRNIDFSEEKKELLDPSSFVTIEEPVDYMQLLDNYMKEQYTSMGQGQREFVEGTGNKKINEFLNIGDKAEKEGFKLKEALAHRRVQEWSLKKGYKPTKDDIRAYYDNSKIVHKFTMKELKKLRSKSL